MDSQIRRVDRGSHSRRLLGWFARLAFAMGLLGSSSAFAQAPVRPPAPPTRAEVERPAPERVEPPRTTLEIANETPRTPCALDRPEYANIRFTLSEVSFDDLRGVSPETLRPAYAPLIGQSLPLATLCQIRDRAAAILSDAGFVVAIEVPEQRIADGRIRFQVVMARLVGLRVRGDAGRAERMIIGYLERLTQRDVFNRYDAERYLLLAGDMPGYTVRLALASAGQARGEVIGEVTVRRIPALVDLTTQNFGSRELGRWGGLLRAQFFDLTGQGDRTSLAFFTTPDLDEQQTLQIAHDFRIGGEGLTLGGQATFAIARPDLGNRAFDIRSRTVFATLEASYPFVRRQDRSLRGTIGLDYIDQDVDLAGAAVNRDRLRVAFARMAGDAYGLGSDARYSVAEPYWRLGAAVEMRQGLNLFDATTPCGRTLLACARPGVVPPTRLEADPTAFVLRGSVDGELRPVPGVTIAAAMRAQYSARPLLSFEEFSAGNYAIGRGYDPGAVLGDSGLGLRAELRLGSTTPAAPDRAAFEPFAFVDQAWAWNEERLFAIPRQELTSLGAGLRLGYGDRLRLEFIVAAPLDRTLFQNDRPVRVLLSLTARLWPWRL
jgi:hemolysin activation/secretion protein